MRQERWPAPMLSLAGQGQRRQRAGAWLALLAMALIFAAPLYSKSMALVSGHHAGHGDHQHHASQAHHGGESAMAGMPAGHDHHSDSLSFDHAECGYCVLLTHVSPISLVAPLITAPLLWARPGDTLTTRAAQARPLRYSLAQSRAPPASIA